VAPHASYKTPPAQWLTEAAIYHTGFTVGVDDDMTSDAAVDRANGHIQIRAGLSLPRFHIALGRSVLFAVYGDEVVPEFRPAIEELPSGVTAFRRHPQRHPRYALSS
jgi:hypothetical protein